MSDIDDDLAIDDEEYHEALLGYREARELMKEARVARGFYPVVLSIRSDKPTGRGKGVEDAQERMIFYGVLKSVSESEENEILEPTHMVHRPATILTILVMKIVHQTRFRWIPCVALRFLLCNHLVW